MHGGLFKDDNVVLDDLRKIDRNRQPPEEGKSLSLLYSLIHWSRLKINCEYFLIHQF